MDDARDLWEDFDAGHCNAFLLAASKMESNLLSSRFDPTTEIRLNKILLRPGWVEQTVTPAIARVYETFKRAPVVRAACEEAAGLLAVSMDRWLLGS